MGNLRASSNNKRIAKNTVFLYVRMFFIMTISLYTSRVVLKELGVEDFGIYNVVGGVIAMMGLLKGAMTTATMRFITFELGRENFEELRKTYSISVTIYFIICVVFIFLAETIGLWFLNTQLTIPDNRMSAANWIYQFTIISVTVEMMSQPYNSIVIAHERMSFYALAGIIEVILKLFFVLSLTIVIFDHLVIYGLFMMLVSLTVCSIYHFYCRRHFQECHFKLYKDKTLFKRMLSYSGWNLFGSSASVVKSQGLNILLNLFFNPTVNAARGISYQINAAVSQFSHNFYTAVRPQITKYYAQNDLNNMFLLVFRSSKMSFYMNLLLGVPLIMETKDILYIWLGQIPEHTVIFSQLIIIISLIDAMAHPLMTSIHATGHVALYQSLVGSMYLLNIPISYFFLKHGYPPVTVFVVSLVITIFNLFARLFLVRHFIPSFPLVKYVLEVFVICLLVSIASFVLPVFSAPFAKSMMFSFFVESAICVVSVLCSVFFLGLNKEEKFFLKKVVMSKIFHK